MAADVQAGPGDDVTGWIWRIASALAGSGLLVAFLLARVARAEAKAREAGRRADLAEAEAAHARDELADRLGEQHLLHGRRARGSDPTRPSGSGLTAGSRLAQLRAKLRDRRRR